MHNWIRLGVLLACSVFASAAELKTRNVVLIMSDGLRWQEVFSGAERQLISREFGGVKNTNSILRDFWRETPEERRAALLPFFWNEVARNGQLLGNRARGSSISVANKLNFSYPGYNEIITGIPDPRINSNDRFPNPNTNVFEFLNTKSGLKNRIAIFGTWNVFPYIFNVERSRLPIWPPFEPKFEELQVPVPGYLNEFLRDTTPLWEDVVIDSALAQAAMLHFEKERPRVMFVGFGETDEWAHAGRYDLYLHAAHHMDAFVRRLWEAAQSKSRYRNKTTLIITADHGRGTGTEDWKSHGEKIAGSEADWIAVIGPDTPPVGERTQGLPYTQGQIAATIAALLGHDFRAVSPKSAEPITELFGD